MHGSLWNFYISIVKKFPNYNKYWIQGAMGDEKKMHSNVYAWGIFDIHTQKNVVRVVHCVHYLLISENTTMLSPGCLGVVVCQI